MPVPTPILQLTKNHTIIPSLREVQKDGSIQYLEKHQTDGKEEKQPVSTNPYKEINNQLFRDIVKNNQKQSQTHFYVVPLLHPILDTQDYVETLLHNNQVPALKIH
jgi:hypothetical protein